MNPAYSVILPVRNEEKNVEHVAKSYAAINRRIPIEVIFVEDGGSRDDTRGVLRRLAKTHPFIKPLFISKRGYGVSIREGLKTAKGEFVCWTHADMQTDPKDTLTAYRLITARADKKECLVKGKRKGRPIADVFFTIGMAAFETILLGKTLWDINAQPNMFHRNQIKMIEQAPSDFAFDLYVYYIFKSRKMPVVRFPVLFTKRLHGTSNWNVSLSAKWRFIKRTMSFSMRMKKSLASR
ncbi:MAG: glycosyltransferase family 2 protein [Nanoarchaeota archaeon]